MPRCQRPSREIPHADPEIKVGRSAGESELPFRCLHPFRAQGSKSGCVNQPLAWDLSFRVRRASVPG